MKKKAFCVFLFLLIPTIALAQVIEGNDSSFAPSVSADGMYIAFASDADNLVQGDFNNRRDIFVQDTTTGEIVRVSVDSAGLEADGNSNNPFISADGRLIAYESDATNLVEGGTNNQHIYLYDMMLARTYCISCTGSIVALDNTPQIADENSKITYVTDNNSQSIETVSSTSEITTDSNLTDPAIRPKKKDYGLLRLTRGCFISTLQER